jgi:hypothetical protein
MTAAPVIIESDALGAWLGLVGVLTGAAITTATTWLLNRQRLQVEQLHELEAAKGQVIASATSIIVLVGWYHGARSIQPDSRLRNPLGTESEWVEKIADALERLQSADRTIQLYGKRDVARASRLLVAQAADFARGQTKGPEGLDDAIASFREVWDS